MNHLLLLFPILFMGFIDLQAQNTDNESTTKPPLTEVQVKRFLKTEIAIKTLQKKVQAEAGQTENPDLIHAFYKKEKELIKARGWKPKTYKDIRSRIYEAKDGMLWEATYKNVTFPGKKSDWPAVKPYLDVLGQLTEWFAGNRKEPPKISR